MRLLCRLFAPESDILGSSSKVPCRLSDEKYSCGDGGEGGEEGPPSSHASVGNLVVDVGAGASVSSGEHVMLSPEAKVAFPGLIDKYCGFFSQEDRGLGGSEWLDSDDITCEALESDVHALAMILFVEWREFVSVLPGCGTVLARETSALWLAQVREWSEGRAQRYFFL